MARLASVAAAKTSLRVTLVFMIVILLQKEEANATSLNWSKDARSENVLAVT